MTAAARRSHGKIAWGSLVLEVFSVFLGVALGFAVSEWRDDHARAARADAALQSIAAELRQNREAVQRSHDYYTAVRPVLDGLAGSTSPAQPLRGSSVPGWRGIYPPVVRESSYRVAAMTGALADLDFSTLDALARAYWVQDELQRSIDTSLELAIRGDLVSVASWQRVFGVLDELSVTLLATYPAAEGILPPPIPAP